MKKKLLSILLVTAMVATMAAGCGGSGDSASESEEGGGNSITVLVESGSPAEALANETAADFEEETGCKVIVDAVAYTGMYDKLSTEIKAPEKQHMTLPAWTSYGWRLSQTPLSLWRTQIPATSFPHWKKVGTIDGNLLGYPMWTNCKILIYRKDIIPEDKVPTTWDEYKAVAEEVATSDMYGTTVLGSGSDAVCSYLDFACQAGAEGLVFDADGNVNITTQPYVDAMNFMVETADADYTPSDALATAATESQELFTNGKTAMQINWSPSVSGSSRSTWRR